MITEKLKSIHSNQKSFYGKAKINILENGTKELISYKTKVAIITKGGNFIKLWDGYSLTTMNHINEFRMQNGLNKINKKEWLELVSKERKTNKKRIKLYNAYNDEDKIEYFEMNQLNRAIARLEIKSKKTIYKFDYDALKKYFKNPSIGDDFELNGYKLEIVR